MFSFTKSDTLNHAMRFKDTALDQANKSMDIFMEDVKVAITTENTATNYPPPLQKKKKKKKLATVPTVAGNGQEWAKCGRGGSVLPFSVVRTEYSPANNSDATGTTIQAGHWRMGVVWWASPGPTLCSLSPCQGAQPNTTWSPSVSEQRALELRATHTDPSGCRTN
jgi:hypothetical protein